MADRPYLWLLPVALLLGAFYVAPVADVVRLSFSDATLLRPADSFGLQSWSVTLGADGLGGILWNTAEFTLLSVLGLQLAGLGVALLLARGDRRGLRGMTVLRTVVLAAWVIPGIANGLIWQMLFSEAPFGAVNSTLALMGLPRVAWLSDPGNAMLSAVIANIWQGTAFSMIVFYAARSAIGPRLYEAAEVDGASAGAQFLYITLPQIKGAILVNSVIVTIQTLNTFDSILALTGGGPGRATEVLSLHIFNLVFTNFDLAGGSVLALVLVAISTVLTLIYIAVLAARR